MAEEGNVDVEARGGRWASSKLGCGAFSDSALERMYQSYRLKQKRGGLKTFLLAALCLDAFIGSVRRFAPVAWCSIAGAVLALFLYAMELVERGKFRCGGRSAAFIGWVSAVLVLPAAPPPLCPIAYIYLLMVALPLRLRYCILLTIFTAVSYELSLTYLNEQNEDVFKQNISNAILMSISALLGLLGFLLDDRQQRQAFLETRQSLEVKLVIEEQSAEQERLLLSVLPEHVAVRMRQDLGSTDTQFKKIYMSRHENVSILYADIVGFTAISSTYSAQDLVAILNDLFARFDRLAEKYHQLRIKILGDCYYCISGAPVETPDHAALCVRMGLAMVKSIKYLQQTTNSPVDMRVGIHTGAVLAGVLGQRQWQFDVYSRDVELANKMESSGNAGRVHISEKTLSFLHGEFEVEPAYGEKREEALRLAGIKTYFIVKVLKPFGNEGKSGEGDAVTNSSNKAGDNGKAVLNNVSKKGEENETAEVLADAPSDTKDEGDSIKSPVDEEKDGLGENKKEDSDVFNKRLRRELVKRDGNKLLAKHTGIFLSFQTPEMEAAYKKRGGLGVAAGAPLATAVLLPSLVLLAAITVVKPPPEAIPLAAAATALMLVIAAPFLTHNRTEWERMSALGRRMSGSPELRLLATTAAILLLTLHNAAQMIVCARSAESNTNCTAGCAVVGCAGGVLAAALGALAPLPLWARAGLAVLAATPPALISYFRLGDLLDCYDLSPNSPLQIPTKHFLYLLMGLITVALIVLSNHLESTSRVLFLWKGQIEEQRERAADMRRRNEALVYNILPPHVAVHFMGNKRRQHHELYSQSYAEVGVLFASMPNFAEFYSEETVNNQGLECLRFLNEVISDFDALLEKAPFQDIIKIKTIGSSYMAATGLNPSRHVKADDPITVRWFHLSLLVEFALELKQALQCINEQSFNHFVLKMGINHGPITAGVIGARKPHYDIWGNTVNVASRMESTGKAGCIQVTEDTSNILKNFGYKFEQRGLVSVKGKGQLLTYYLLGKDGYDNMPEPIIEHTALPVDTHIEQPKPADVQDVNLNEKPTPPMNNGVPKSPNGSVPRLYNGVAPLSPSCKESAPNEAVKNCEKRKLLPQEDSCTDLNIDARESDALLKN